MNDYLSIAVTQSLITSDVSQNGLQIREMMAQAKEAGARLIHFPEGALSGYVKSQIQSWDEVHWDHLKVELIKVMEAAERLGLWVVIGCNHRLTDPNRPHNSLFVISDTGEVVTRYDKRFCSHSEITEWYSPGRHPRMFTVDGFKLGCALCIEVQFPEVFSEYERLGADGVLFSAYSDDSMFWIQSQGHAAANNIWVSVSVPAQCAENMQGGLIAPNGQALSRCTTKTIPSFCLVELNKNSPELQIALTKARPWRQKARLGDIYKPGVVGDNRSDPLCF